MGTWIDFKELRSKLNISSLLDHYKVQLKVKGDRATGFCPLPGHRSKGDGKRHSPSFSVNLRKGIFQCFSCGAKGNALDLGIFLQGLDPNDSSQLREGAMNLQEIFGLASSHLPQGKVKSAPAHSASSPPADEQNATAAIEVDAKPGLPIVVNAPLDFELKHLDPDYPYLKLRGINTETVRHFSLGYCSKGMLAGRIAIPLHDAAGTLIGYAGRLVDDGKVTDEAPKYRFPGERSKAGVTHQFQKSLFLYGGYRIKPPVDDLVVVEGFASVWWLWQNGITNTVALMGSSVSEQQTALLLELLGPSARLWICTDGDPAGDRCAGELFVNIGTRHFVRRIAIPGRQPTDLSTAELATHLPFLK